MKHFEISQWADMVRGLVAGEESAEMSAHLSSGCQSCRRTVETLREVARTAGWDSRHKVPSYAVQSARAIFALQKPEKIHFFPRIVGQLVYDSFREPLPAGLRSRHRLTRHTLYQAGDYSMDIRMEHLRGMPKVTLVGQIFNRVHPDEPLAILPVYLVSGKEILARTCSNNFGEFQLDYQPGSRLSLHIRGNRYLRSQIELPLGRLGGGETIRPTPQPRPSKKKH